MRPLKYLHFTTAVMALVTTLTFASEATARSTPAYCKALRSSATLKNLPTALSRLPGAAAPAAANDVRAAANVLLRARRSAGTRGTRSRLGRVVRTLRKVGKDRRLVRRDGFLLHGDFTELGRGLGKRCGLPVLVGQSAVFDSDLPSTATRSGASLRSGVDWTLCSHRNDARVVVPQDFRLNACWDGSTLRFTNRTDFVLELRVSGSANSPRRVVAHPQTLPSLFVARDAGDNVLPPDYGAIVGVWDGPGSVNAEFAPERVQWKYGIAKIVVGYIPFEPLAFYEDVAELVRSLDAAMVAVANCLRGANIMRKVACAAQFNASAVYAVGVFAVSRAMNPASKVRLHRLAAVLWGHVQTGTFLYDTAHTAAGVMRGARRLDIAARSQVAPPPGPPPPGPPPPPPPPAYYSYRVFGTCADGACGLKIRNGPGYTNYQQIGVLSDGDELRIVCQARGERVGPSPRTGNSSSIWDRLQGGGWVSDLYATTPNVDQFSPPIPQC